MRKYKKSKITLHCFYEARKGSLVQISEFLTQVKLAILKAAVVTLDSGIVYSEFLCELNERLFQKSFDFLFSTIDVFVAESDFIKECVVYSYPKKEVLHRAEVPDHKQLLVNCVSALPSALIQQARRSKEVLFQIHPRIFEEVVAEIFSANGFEVELTQRSRDGGKDIIAVKYDLGIPSRWIVECKRYRTRKVDVKLVRELFGIKESERYNNAVLVTTSEFTNPAIEFERSVWGLSLADYNALMEWIKGYRFSESGGIYLADDLRVKKQG
ncbi:MAG: restriction endonuclease [Deltaproteobacteria bacterium]|nr:restriction endonuclease [Deltaproteobacteria bacterium]